MKTLLIVFYYSLSGASPDPAQTTVFERTDLASCLRDARNINREPVVKDKNGVVWRIEAFCQPKVERDIQ